MKKLLNIKLVPVFIINLLLGISHLYANEIFIIDDAQLPSGEKFLAPAFTEIDKKERSWTISIDIKNFSGVKVKKTPLKGLFHHISVSGMKNSQTPGKPQLPYYSFLIKGHPEEITTDVFYDEVKTFNNIVALPAPQKPCRCQNDNSKAYTFKIENYHQKEESVLEFVFLGDYRGEEITKVIVRPFIQKGSHLRVFKNLKITLESKEILKLNDFTATSDKMILITPEKLKRSARSFKEFKEEAGFPVEMFIFEEIANDAKSLRSFLKNKFKEEQYQYAVLFGHEGLLPPLKTFTSSDPDTPSDYPYFLFGGVEDFFPDVFYSRIVADSNEEIEKQVMKMREFRDRTWKDPQGDKTVIGIASNEGWDPNDVEYMNQMINPLLNFLGFEKRTFFENDQNSNPREINKALNEGAIWLNYIGHGSGDSWSSITRGEYSVRDINKLKFGAVKPIIIDVACQNGRFTYNNKFGERFMNATDKGYPSGAVAYYGGSVDISWDPPAIMAVAIGENLAERKASGLFELILRGQRYLIENYEDSEAAIENLRWYHLFGDPSMRIDQL